MVQLNQAVQAQETEVRSIDLLPVGYYKAVAISEEEKDTNDGNGKYIKLEFDITAGEYVRRKLWENYNIVNANPTAVKIALEKLGSFAWAIGVTSLSDTKDLLFKEVTVEVGIQPASKKNGKEYQASNTIKAFWPHSWSDAEIEGHKKSKKSGAGVSGAPKPATAPTANKPWAKK